MQRFTTFILAKYRLKFNGSWQWFCFSEQCRRKGNISGEGGGGGLGACSPRKFLKSRGLEMLFPAFSKSYLGFTHIANYLLRTLSQQTNAH